MQGIELYWKSIESIYKRTTFRYAIPGKCWIKNTRLFQEKRVKRIPIYDKYDKTILYELGISRINLYYYY